MALKTPTEWAELYEAAIAKIVAGTVSSYTVAGQSFTKHNLPELERLYRYWRARAAEDSGGFVTYADMRHASYEETDDT